MRTYVDTSVLAKWYLPEAESDRVEQFIQSSAPVAISSLTVLEFRSVLAKRRRARMIRPTAETRVLASLRSDIEHGHLIRHPVEDPRFEEAVELLDAAKSVPLTTLDALHLAMARHIQAEAIATADRVMASAAQALSLRVIRFG